MSTCDYTLHALTLAACFSDKRELKVGDKWKYKGSKSSNRIGCLFNYSTVEDLFCLHVHVAQFTVAVVGRLSGL